MDKRCFTIEEGCGYLGIGRAYLYRLLAEGAISSFHIGRRNLVLKEELDRFIELKIEEEALRV